MSLAGQSESLEIELIRSLFETLAPSLIMTGGFVIAGTLIFTETQDALILAMLVAGVFCSAIRIAIGWLCGPRAARHDITLDEARRLQRHFAAAYVTFAAVLGIFAFRAMQLPAPEVHVLLMSLLVGYAAGVAASIGLRPMIAVPSMMVAVIPTIVAAMAKPHPLYWGTGLVTAAFLAGGINAVNARYGRAMRSIGRRIAFAALARQDVLTALPNRLALREWFDQQVNDTAAQPAVAVHYLDLNGFKPVNDQFGHPVGDALLVAVSKRIARTVRQTDIAARLGGDEFAVVQCGITRAEEAEWLAHRLVDAIGRPYSIEDHTITISTCVGYVIAEEAHDLEDLLTLADEALYASKRGAGAVTRWQISPARRAAA